MIRHSANRLTPSRLRTEVESAMHALFEGVNNVHFIDGRTPHSLLLEIFANAGVGRSFPERARAKPRIAKLSSWGLDTRA